MGGTEGTQTIGCMYVIISLFPEACDFKCRTVFGLHASMSWAKIRQYLLHRLAMVGVALLKPMLAQPYLKQCADVACTVCVDQ